MGRELCARAAGRDRLAHADEVLGYSLSRIMLEGDEQTLGRTIHTQPAVFVYSMVLYDALADAVEVTPCAGAGHSLGEYTALCCAGTFTFDDALRVIQVRAQAMDQAQADGSCGMAAILGVDGATALHLIEDARTAGFIEAANFNAPDQIVVSGKREAISRLGSLLKAVKRAKLVPLTVSSAFHTSLMGAARDTLEAALENVSVSAPRFPVIANATARPYPSDDAQIRRLLCDQMTCPVLWEDSMRTILRLRPAGFVEIGPGKTLAGLLKRIDRAALVGTINDYTQVGASRPGEI
jgi:[acyl-carrier-protein] S-malonyltransferase